ncbi:MAG: hypothetical protein IPH39_06945 [Sulfuritalea sp.]|nr:hypothetical protein [Sulfuritalea sp.]
MTPSKQELQDKAKHFANTVFVIGAGVIMFSASWLQPYTMKWLGGATGEQLPFIAGTLLIVMLAMKRPAFALFALERQCQKYGHAIREGSPTCERCFRKVGDGGAS